MRDINRRYKKWRATAVETALAIIDLGERLAKLKRHVEVARGYGHWEAFVADRAEFLPPIRTCQKFMFGAESKDDPLLSTDPLAWAPKIWGNKPKAAAKDRNAVDGASKERTGDDKQSGGPGFNPGFDPEKKTKPAFLEFKNLVAALEVEFFGSETITAKEKLQFIEELIRWLEGRRNSIAAASEKTD